MNTIAAVHATLKSTTEELQVAVKRLHETEAQIKELQREIHSHQQVIRERSQDLQTKRNSNKMLEEENWTLRENFERISELHSFSRSKLEAVSCLMKTAADEFIAKSEGKIDISFYKQKQIINANVITIIIIIVTKLTLSPSFYQSSNMSII